jgi:UDP:flavonoid glycosyltransferase YjiC (YdhE family)
VLLRDCQRLAERALMDIGSEPFDGLFMDWPPQIAGRYIHAGVPQFEYPRRDLPESVQFVGAMLPTGVDNWEPPAWWEEMLEARRNGRRVALVTQGTSSRNPEHLMLPAAEGLADQDLTVVLTTGGLDPETVLPAARRPANLRIEKFVPYTELLPFMDVMVTNGGYGGVQMSLAYGVPLVVAGQTDDRMEVNARVAWSGSGISLKTNQPSPAQVGRAVRTILDDPSFGARARELQAAYARYDGPSHAAEAIIAEARAMRSPSKARRESRPAEAPPTLEVAGVSTDD